MTCQTLREIIVDLARDQPASAGSAAAVEIHLMHCAACVALLERERALTAGLRALGADAEMAGASAATEARLMQAFAEQQAGEVKAPGAGLGWWVRAAAVVLVAVGAGAWWQAAHAPRPDGGAGVADAARSGLVEGFMPLPVAMGLPDLESGEIVRVELSVGSLPSYGIEVVPDATRSWVQADLLVGQDGLARAIRLVRSADDRAVAP